MRSFRIYIDENLPVQLAKGLNILQEPQNKKDNCNIEVISITEKFGRGAKDEDWIPEVGKEGGIVITQDYRIQTQKHQRELYRQHGVGILFINPPSKSGFSYWEMVKKVVNEWEDVKVILRKEKSPFAFRCTAKTKFIKFE